MKDFDDLLKQYEGIQKASSLSEKIALLDQNPKVKSFIGKSKLFRTFLSGLTLECEFAFKQLALIGQAERLFEGVDDSHFPIESLRDLLSKLLSIDQFYKEIGGIIGYQIKVLSLIGEKKEENLGAVYHAPVFHEIGEENEGVRSAVASGIESLSQMAEMYPLGGAADRLHLVDEKTGIELPAAKLPFGGRTLLERLILDLQARESLYYKLYGKRLITPIAMMTSFEKNNHVHVLEICREKKWFGRGEENFRFFTQPLVPAVQSDGNWCVLGPLKPLLKPGGHGALWKLARDAGIFSWFREKGRNKVLVRQINNPLAGLDFGLLALTGLGIKENRVFGFASCPRALGAAEGVNVLVERKKGERSELVLTNVEYCDFAKNGIEDKPLKMGEPYSRFSSNTNILFGDLKAIEDAVKVCPFPGLLLNLKKGSFRQISGEAKEAVLGRLESTMQNIADVFIEEKSPEAPKKTDRTFVTYNQRHKTISTAKRAYIPGGSLQETPENCFYDLLFASRELLQTRCAFALPSKRSLQEYLEKGPEVLFLYHPALGPLYSVIEQKLQKGRIEMGSELLLDIAEANIKHLRLMGSLQIQATHPMGDFDTDGILRYSDQAGSCVLENVTIQNRGVNWSSSAPFWKMNLARDETMRVILKGRSRFTARNVCFSGNLKFVVEEGMEMRVEEKEGQLLIEELPLK